MKKLTILLTLIFLLSLPIIGEEKPKEEVPNPAITQPTQKEMVELKIKLVQETMAKLQAQWVAAQQELTIYQLQYKNILDEEKKKDKK